MANKLKDFSDEDLQAELEHLQAELERRKEKELNDSFPKPLDNPDFSALQKFIVESFKEAVKNGYIDNELPHYIYEEAVSTVFGHSLWKWLREHKIHRS